MCTICEYVCNMLHNIAQYLYMMTQIFFIESIYADGMYQYFLLIFFTKPLIAPKYAKSRYFFMFSVVCTACIHYNKIFSSGQQERKIFMSVQINFVVYYYSRLIIFLLLN